MIYHYMSLKSLDKPLECVYLRVLLEVRGVVGVLPRHKKGLRFPNAMDSLLHSLCFEQNLVCLGQEALAFLVFQRF
jgi:hypothetical protein